MSNQRVGEKDNIVVVMGPTGAGKSTFIDIATRQHGETIGHKLRSETSDVQSVRISHPSGDGRSMVLVDTPGFDDSKKSDMEILVIISNWLVKLHNAKVNLTGILYLHRISDNRMNGTTLKNLRMFGSLCGNFAMPNVLIVTTMWGEINVDVGIRREVELKKEYWHEMISAGSDTARFLDTFGSAWEIIDTLHEKSVVLISQEMVVRHLPINETAAGVVLYEDLQRLLRDQAHASRRLEELAVRQGDQVLVQQLEMQKKAIDEKISRLSAQVERLKISWKGRWRRLTGRKVGKALNTKIYS